MQPQTGINQILAKLREIPPLPVAAQKLLELVNDDRTSAKDLTKILESDQALAGKILQLVNSSFYGFAGKITTLSHAVVILGFSAINHIAISFAAFDSINKIKCNLDWKRYWLHSIASATGGKLIAEGVKYPVPEEAFIGCLVHDIGYAVLSAALPQKMDELIAAGSASNPLRQEETFGMTHNEAGALVLENWRFPTKFCELVRYCAQSRRLGKKDCDPLLPIAMLADVYASLSGYGIFSEPQISDTSAVLRTLSVEPESLTSKILEIIPKVRAAGNYFGIDTDLAVFAAAKGREVVHICPDAARSGWIRLLCQSWKMAVISEKELQARIGTRPPLPLVLLEAQALRPEPMLKLAKRLRESGVEVLVITDEDRASYNEQGQKTIPVNFTIFDILGEADSRRRQ